MWKAKLLSTAGVFAVLFLTWTATLRAGALNQMMYVTFSGSVQLPGVVLTRGTYVFERAEPQTSDNLIRVLSGDRKRVYLLAFTRRIDRPIGMPRDQVVSFGEAPAGSPPPVTAWYPRGEDRGHEFIYSAAR